MRTLTYRDTSVHHGDTRPSARGLIEMLAVMAATILPILIWPSAKAVLALLPIAYVLVERRVRGRTWAELGLTGRGFKRALVTNWPLVVLVAVVIQIAVLGIARLWWPAFGAHVQARIPLLDAGQLTTLLVLLPLALLGEELTYRSLVQGRLNWFVPQAVAIGGASVIFAAMHISAGAPAIVLADVALVGLDSMIYGVIFARTQNLWIAWLAHLLADVIGVGVIVLLW